MTPRKRQDTVHNTETPETLVQTDAVTTAAMDNPVVLITNDEDKIHVVVPKRKVVQKITIISGKARLMGLRIPIGYSTEWKEDKIITQTVEANARMDIIIPDQCDLKKWVKYYQSLRVLGIQVLKFGLEEIKEN